VAKAVDVGINFFDTAAVYGRGRSEEYLGRAVKELDLRDRVYIATKIHGEWLRRVDILTSVENQRRRLGVDAIDLYQIHWPACWHNTPICETIGGADKPGLGEVHRPDLLPALKGSSWAAHQAPSPGLQRPLGRGSWSYPGQHRGSHATNRRPNYLHVRLFKLFPTPALKGEAFHYL
jgi:hypothetical protein